MYTITRKIAVVCLAVVFSVLVYGCGGGDNQQASTDTPSTDTPSTDTPSTDTPDGMDMVMTPTVDMSMVTAGLIIPAGTFTILPGESRDQYDATFTCPAGGMSCEVTVADDGTATSVGGLATAMNSVPGNAKLEVSNDVDTSDVTVGLEITAGTYTIQPGGSMDAGDATFTCSAGGVPCVVTVADNGTATSAGGTAMAMNSAAGTAKVNAPSGVDTSDVTVGLEITAGTYTIQPGGSMDAGDATFTCSELGAPCVVTVADDGTVTSAGGTATAMNSSDGNSKVYASNKVDISAILAGLIIKPGMYTILPGADMDLFDANFECPEGGLPCIVRVDLNADGTTTVTSAGGLATAMLSASADMKLGVTGPVDMSTVTAGLTDVTAGTYPLQPGGNMDAGEVTFTCPVSGVRCVVTVTVTDDLDEDGEKTGTTTTTVTFLGGMAMASDSAVGMARLAESTVIVNTAEGANNVPLTGLAAGYTTIPPGTYPVQPGENMDAGEANFQCPADGVPCVVTVSVVANADGTTATTTITSVGGVATIRNSVEVMTTRAALFLNTASSGALNSQNDGELTAVGVTRSTDGATTTITLTPSDTVGIEYTSTEVDAGHANRYSGWSGQTITRGGDDDLTIPEEATVYTNIVAATPKKLTYGGTGNTGGDVPAPSALVSFVLAAGQGNDASLNMVEQDMARTFRGAYGGISGRFTCAAGATCTDVETATNVGDQRILNNQLTQGWTFESDGYVESVAMQSVDFMYYGYWLRSPADPSIANAAYQFSAFFGGGTGGDTDEGFMVGSALTDADDALKATYKGGAAGRYVTRKLSFTDQGVDAKSPAYHGRFTANAELNAYFGAHSTYAEIS